MKSPKNQLNFTILKRFDFLIIIYENDDSNDNDDDDCDDDITLTSTINNENNDYKRPQGRLIRKYRFSDHVVFKFINRFQVILRLRFPLTLSKSHLESYSYQSSPFWC